MAKLDPVGVKHEVDFWTTFLESERFRANWIGEGKNPELRDGVHQVVASLPPGSRILDVGSGPASILRGSVPRGSSIVCCDPLSMNYSQLEPFTRYGLTQPYPYAAEELPANWTASFEVAHISNALDHTMDPRLAFDQLARCVAPGGLLIVQGFVNEAHHENWAGFHQWNICLDGQQLTYQGKKTKVERLDPPGNMTIEKAWTEVLDTGREWMVWMARHQQ